MSEQLELLKIILTQVGETRKEINHNLSELRTQVFTKMDEINTTFTESNKKTELKNKGTEKDLENHVKNKVVHHSHRIGFAGATLIFTGFGIIISLLAAPSFCK